MISTVRAICLCDQHFAIIPLTHNAKTRQFFLFFAEVYDLHKMQLDFCDVFI